MEMMEDHAVLRERTDIVQFSCSTYICEEREELVEVDVMRMGALMGEATVKFETLNNSGKAGDRYEATQGLIKFGDGIADASIRIPILYRQDWSPTLEFKVQLSEPVNCTLGYYLHICRVRVMDNDVFPTDRYRSQIAKSMQGARDAPEWGLMREFVKMIFKQRGLRLRTSLILFGDQLQNAYAFLKFTLQAYLVNIVLNYHDDSTVVELLIEGNRFLTAAFVGAMYILPMALLHLWDHVKIRLDIVGNIRVFLSTCLFRSFLTYNAESRNLVDPAEIQRGLIQETADLALGYELVLNALQMLGKLVVMVLFVCFSEPSAIWIVAAMPFLISIYAALRGNRVQVERQSHDRRERSLLNVIRQTCEKYDTIHHYNRRSWREEMYRKQAHETREALLPLLTIMNNNLYASRWLGPVFMGLYVCISSPMVLLNKLKLGYFLSVINILDSMSSLFEDLYRTYQKMEEIFEPLLTLTIYFNLPHDLAQQKKAMEQTSRWQATLKNGNQAHLTHYDSMPIVLDNVSYSFSDQPITQNVSMKVPQGGLIAITGNHGSGKCTFLKMLASVILPHRGNVHIPSHLRKLFVSVEPVILLDLTLWENLTLGCVSHIDPDAVQQVLELMGMVKVVKALQYFDRMYGIEDQEPASARDIEDNGVTDSATTSLLDKGKDLLKASRAGIRSSVSRFSSRSRQEGRNARQQRHEHDEIVNHRKKELGSWFEKLNYTEKAKIHLARAFIMNPEIMVMHRPLMHFDGHTSSEIVSHMLVHIKNRGLALPATTSGLRRPRTIFCSADQAEPIVAVADMIWDLHGNTKSVVCKTKPPSSLPPPSQFAQNILSRSPSSLGMDRSSLDMDRKQEVVVGVAMGFDEDLLHIH